jgi:metal-responsive CopG/Arc/MetJ family transcriptional regulator
MAAIQVVLGKELLKAADTAARRRRIRRSTLIRDALREHLKRLRIREAEARERRAYKTIPDDNEFDALERITVWPDD